MQNRVNRAAAPADVVRQIGVTTEKSSPNFIAVVHMVSPDERYDALYLRNYAALNVRDQLPRIPGIGTVIAFGLADYAMRIWLDPNKLAARNLSSATSCARFRASRTRRWPPAWARRPRPGGTDPARRQHAGRLTSEASSPT